MSKKQIIIMNEGVTYDVKDKDDCVNAIIEEYKKFNVSMYDLLAGIEIQGFSTEDVIEIYATCMYKSDGDYIVHVREPEIIDYRKHEFLGGII